LSVFIFIPDNIPTRFCVSCESLIFHTSTNYFSLLLTYFPACLFVSSIVSSIVLLALGKKNNRSRSRIRENHHCPYHPPSPSSYHVAVGTAAALVVTLLLAVPKKLVVAMVVAMAAIGLAVVEKVQLAVVEMVLLAGLPAVFLVGLVLLAAV
jgi:hypothetical protein